MSWDSHQKRYHTVTDNAVFDDEDKEVDSVRRAGTETECAYEFGTIVGPNDPDR